MLRLKDALKDWLDVDVAEYQLAVSLGLMEPTVQFAAEGKHVFWSNNPVGHTLHLILEKLTEIGVLERRDEPDIQYRWNSEFRGTWEEPYYSDMKRKLQTEQ